MNVKNPDISQQDKPKVFDLVVIGGGINGCGIARDAAGRGLSVYLCEMGDLAQATSSASTKLFHGGLRYLEFFEFGLVRKALKEREVLLKAMPHIARPMRFVLPYDPTLKYPEALSTLGKILHRVAPFLNGRRPAWLVRAGLFIYDHLGGRKILPATRTLNLKTDDLGKPLQPRFTKAFEYSDCWVDDARLVILNARDAADRGAEIHTQTTCLSARRLKDFWQLSVQRKGGETTESVFAKCVINAGGPWVDEILQNRIHQKSDAGIRLVRGSHIVVPKLFDHNQPYFFQLSDGRIIFSIPYQGDFTLIGTTDEDHVGDPESAKCTSEEMDYLLTATNQFFNKQITREDVVWTYSGVRPLYDDHSGDATSATRDYVLTLHDIGGALPLLSVFGGKITTYRWLAEDALHKLKSYFPQMSKDWTETASLPGGDFQVDAFDQQVVNLRLQYRFLDAGWAERLIRAYGTRAKNVLGNAETTDDLGKAFGSTLYEAEIVWMVKNEWAKSQDDVLWRRSKLGLHLSQQQQNELAKAFPDIVESATKN